MNCSPPVYWPTAFDSRIGKWFSLDAKEKAYISPYQYVSNNPLNHVDPDGNDDFHFFFRTTAIYRVVQDPRNPSICSTHVLHKTTASIEIVKTNGPDKFYHHKQFAKATFNSFGLGLENGNLISDKVTEFQPFAGGRKGLTKSPLGGWPVNQWFTTPDNDNATLQKYMYSSGKLVDYIVARGLTGRTNDDDGWNKALNLYKVNGFLDRAIEFTGHVADIATFVAPILSSAKYATVYRTISIDEMKSLAKGEFAFGPNGSTMKQFFLTEDAYNAYIKTAFANGYKLEMQVPRSLIGDGKTLNTAVQVDGGVVGDGIKTATVHGQEGLNILTKEAKNIRITIE